VLQRVAIVISSILLGIFGGAAVGWLIGRTAFFFAAELPNRNLPPEQFAIATFDQGFGVGVLTFFFLIPIGIAMGAGAGLWIGMRQVNEEAESD
jgi:membrane protein YqaA with SNARE-associated domain